MSKDKDKLANQDDPSLADAKESVEASDEVKQKANEDEDLDEGLNESFPGSDAPASTMRSGKDDK